MSALSAAPQQKPSQAAVPLNAHSQSAVNLMTAQSAPTVATAATTSSATQSVSSGETNGSGGSVTGSISASSSTTSANNQVGDGQPVAASNGPSLNGAHQKAPATAVHQNGPLPHNSSVVNASNGNMSGYLFKWTNYLKGYQKRWIFLNNGFLSYYRYLIKFIYNQNQLSPLDRFLHLRAKNYD